MGSSLWIWLDGGLTLCSGATFGQKLALWWGYRLAVRHRKVDIHPSCKISPESRIHPRSGAIVIGRNCSVSTGAIIQGTVKMGSNCSVQAYSILVGETSADGVNGGIEAGQGVRIAPQTVIFSANHVYSDPNRMIYEQGMAAEGVRIEDDVWLASHVVVTAGVCVGRGSIVAAGAVVTRNIPPYSVAAGIPARVIRKRKQPDQAG